MRTVHRGGGQTKAALLRSAKTKALSIWQMTDSHLWELAGTSPSRDAGVQFMYSTIPGKLSDFVAQINAAKPHVFVHTGDAVEIADATFDPTDLPAYEFGAFRARLWDLLDPAITKVYVPGNHDYTIVPDSGSSLQQTIAHYMGYGSDPVVAGGRFNKSLALTGNGVTVRMLAIDTMQERDGTPAGGPYTEQAPVDKGSLSDAQKAWIAAELAASPQDVIFLVSHTGAQDARDSTNVWGVQQDRVDLINIVAAEKAARPKRQITHLFGHVHVTQLLPYGNVPGFPGYLSPCLIQGNPAHFTKYYVFPGGTVVTDVGTVSA